MKELKKLKKKLAKKSIAYIKAHEGANNKEQRKALAEVINIRFQVELTEECSTMSEVVNKSCVALNDLQSAISDSYDKIYFDLAVKNPYPIGEIKEFVELSGLDKRDVSKVLGNLARAGFQDLQEVNKIIRVGYFDFADSVSSLTCEESSHIGKLLSKDVKESNSTSKAYRISMSALKKVTNHMKRLYALARE